MLECLRAVYARAISKRGSIDDPESVHHRLIVLAAIVGVSVGLGAVLFMPSIPLPDQALLVHYSVHHAVGGCFGSRIFQANSGRLCLFHFGAHIFNLGYALPASNLSRGRT